MLKPGVEIFSDCFVEFLQQKKTADLVSNWCQPGTGLQQHAGGAMKDILPRLAPFQNKSLVERSDKDNTWGSADGTSLTG